MSSTFPSTGDAHLASLSLVACAPNQKLEKSDAQAESHPIEGTQLHPSDSQLDACCRNRNSPAASLKKLSGKLHRVAEIREQQGVSERTIARRLGIDVKRYRQLEKPDRDLQLSELLALQAALDVPLIDLLEDRQELSRPVEERAKMIKVMKTAVALRETKSNSRVSRMAQMLCDQLVDLMPELAEVNGWPQFGARRGPATIGRALSQPIDTSNLDMHD
jgi:transcriptional regulator with XRE-family HTH domain